MEDEQVGRNGEPAPKKQKRQMRSSWSKLQQQQQQQQKQQKQQQKHQQQSQQQRNPHEQTQQALITAEQMNETNYAFDEQLRYVVPYYYVFETHSKGRWVGRTVLDVLVTEFQGVAEEQFRRRISCGDITLNHQKITADTRFQAHDLFLHRMHRHEPPVANTKIEIIASTDDYVVVNKPASYTVHPSGRYRHNTLLFVLAKEYGLNNLFLINRLDRLTSGVMIMGRSKAVATKLATLLQNNDIKKEYVAKVTGLFPATDQDVVVDKAIAVQTPRMGYNKVVADGGKDSRTTFRRIAYDKHTDTSLVRCIPETGRTHQIRLHLSDQGHPIVDDPLYNSSSTDINNSDAQTQPDHALKVLSGLFTPDVNCELCTTPVTDDVKISICLHAEVYSCADWTFTATLPDWAMTFGTSSKT